MFIPMIVIMIWKATNTMIMTQPTTKLSSLMDTLFVRLLLLFNRCCWC